METVANRYAIALLSVAREENKIKEYIEEVEQIASLLNKNKEILKKVKIE